MQMYMYITQKYSFVIAYETCPQKLQPLSLQNLLCCSISSRSFASFSSASFLAASRSWCDLVSETIENRLSSTNDFLLPAGGQIELVAWFH